MIGAVARFVVAGLIVLIAVAHVAMRDAWLASLDLSAAAFVVAAPRLFREAR